MTVFKSLENQKVLKGLLNDETLRSGSFKNLKNKENINS